jgi:antitoxin VapB
MALNIKNSKVERLATELARLTGETKTEAIRRALEDRKNRLVLKASPTRDRASKIMDYLEREVWPKIPADVLVKKKMTKREREEILGIGPDGYPE